MDLYKKNIRIKDIAEMANVSVGTVDRVLHNRGNVSSEAKDRIAKIIKDLKFEPNLLAKTLGSNKTFDIAVLMPGTASPEWQDYKQGFEKAEKDYRQFGVYIHYFPYDPAEPASFAKKAHEALSFGAQGIVSLPPAGAEATQAHERFLQEQIPVVLLEHAYKADWVTSFIGMDNHQTGMLAGKLLHYGMQGVGKVVLANVRSAAQIPPSLVEKEKGFKAYFRKQAPEHEILTVTLNPQKDTTLERQLEKLLSNCWPLKGFYVTTPYAFEVARFLKKLGLVNIRLVGHGLNPENVRFLEENVIDFLIYHPFQDMASKAVAALADVLVFKKEAEAAKILPAGIVTKENASQFLD